MKRDELSCFLRDLGRLFQVRRMYPAGNEQIERAAQKAADSLSRVGHRVRLALLGGHVVVEDRVVEDPPVPLCALLQDLGRKGLEGLQVEPGATAAELSGWVGAVVEGGNGSTDRIRAGAFHLAAPHQADSLLTQAASGYLSLMPQVQEALSDLAAERVGGLVRAKEIVHAIAGSLAAGEELLRPIRELKAHDDYTFAHGLNVSVLSSALARARGASPEQVRLVALAGLCHDLGKEKIPPEILNKPGALDSDEKQIMDRHPLEGAKLLLSLDGAVNPLLPVVAYQHHRRADGTGYPKRPAWGRAHPASLLVSVADVYDALRTLRPYRTPRTVAQAATILLQEVRSGGLHGSHVAALASLLGFINPSCRVRLSDGRLASVLEKGESDGLRPLVEAEDGRVVDLAHTGDLWIEEIVQTDP